MHRIFDAISSNIVGMISFIVFWHAHEYGYIYIYIYM